MSFGFGFEVSGQLRIAIVNRQTLNWVVTCRVRVCCRLTVVYYFTIHLLCQGRVLIRLAQFNLCLQ